MALVVVHEAEMQALLSGSQSGVVRDLMRRGRAVQNRAKELVHVDTGRLRASITLTPLTIDGEFAVHVGSNVEYAGFLEYGTSRMPAYPFLRPALEAAR